MMAQLINAFVQVSQKAHLEVIFQVKEVILQQEVVEELVLKFIKEVLVMVIQQVSEMVISRKIVEVVTNTIKQVSMEV